MPTIISALPYTLANGTTADASQVEANFDQIVANVNANAAATGANSDITSLTGLTTPLGRTYGGTQFYVGSAASSGSLNAQTVATVVPTGFSLYTGVMVAFFAGFSNSGATTLNVGGTGVKNVYRQISSGAAACVGGEIVANQLVVVVYDGTQWQLVTSGYLSTPLLRSLGGLTVAAGNIIYGSGAATVAVLAPGTSGQVLTSAGAGAPTWGTPSTNATAAEMEAASSTTAWSTPGLQQRHPGHPKAWARWTPRVSNGVCTITSSYNVSDVSRTAAGTYTVTFTTAFADTTYSMVGVHRFATVLGATVSQGVPATGSCTVFSVDFAGSAYDGSASINAWFIGDQ